MPDNDARLWSKGYQMECMHRQAPQMKKQGETHVLGNEFPTIEIVDGSN